MIRCTRFWLPVRSRRHADRLREYQALLARRPSLLAEARQLLRDKDLACWCSPQPCHADVLLKVAARAAEKNGRNI
jgi:hypothetical protein